MPKRYQVVNFHKMWRTLLAAVRESARLRSPESMRPHAESGRYYYFSAEGQETARRPVWRLRRSGDIWKVI